MKYVRLNASASMRLKVRREQHIHRQKQIHSGQFRRISIGDNIGKMEMEARRMTFFFFLRCKGSRDETCSQLSPLICTVCI